MCNIDMKIELVMPIISMQHIITSSQKWNQQPINQGDKSTAKLFNETVLIKCISMSFYINTCPYSQR